MEPWNHAALAQRRRQKGQLTDPPLRPRVRPLTARPANCSASMEDVRQTVTEAKRLAKSHPQTEVVPVAWYFYDNYPRTVNFDIILDHFSGISQPPSTPTCAV